MQIKCRASAERNAAARPGRLQEAERDQREKQKGGLVGRHSTTHTTELPPARPPEPPTRRDQRGNEKQTRRPEDDKTCTSKDRSEQAEPRHTLRLGTVCWQALLWLLFSRMLHRQSMGLSRQWTIQHGGRGCSGARCNADSCRSPGTARRRRSLRGEEETKREEIWTSSSGIRQRSKRRQGIIMKNVHNNEIISTKYRYIGKWFYCPAFVSAHDLALPSTTS